MALVDGLFRKIAADLADDPNSVGDARKIAKAFEAYDRLVQDISRGASREQIESNELLEKRAKNGDTCVA